MDKVQREHMEAMLIDMTEKLPKQRTPFEKEYEYSPEALQAAAEAARALIALHNVARPEEETPEEKGPTEDEAWELSLKAIRNIQNGRARSREEEFAKLPPIVQKVLKRPDMLYEWGLVSPRMLDTEVQANFREAFRELSAREKPRDRLAREIAVGVTIHVDVTELDEALAKAERLAETLRRADGGE